MKILRTFLLLAALTLAAAAQPAPGAAKPKPYSSGDTHAYLLVADAIQFHLGMSQRMTGKYKDGAPDLLALAGKIRKASTDLWTPGVDAAMAHGVEGKKIPQDMSKNDKASLTKLATVKDAKKSELAFFELYSKEAKKNAHEAENALKTVQDADLKAFVEKAVAQLKGQADELEAKFKELKTRK
jgi:hypothetical protein